MGGWKEGGVGIGGWVGEGEMGEVGREKETPQVHYLCRNAQVYSNMSVSSDVHVLW